MDSGQRRLLIGEVRSALAALFGVKCWRVGSSYGDELRLDIGRRRPADTTGSGYSLDQLPIAIGETYHPKTWP